MDLTQEVLLAIAAIFAILMLVRLFATPLRLAVKLILNTVIGFFALIVLNLTAAFTGISLGVNLINAAVIGILGLPGFALLVLAQWIFAI